MMIESPQSSSNLRDAAVQACFAKPTDGEARAILRFLLSINVVLGKRKMSDMQFLD